AATIPPSSVRETPTVNPSIPLVASLVTTGVAPHSTITVRATSNGAHAGRTLALADPARDTRGDPARERGQRPGSPRLAARPRAPLRQYDQREGPATRQFDIGRIVPTPCARLVMGPERQTGLRPELRPRRQPFAEKPVDLVGRIGRARLRIDRPRAQIGHP